MVSRQLTDQNGGFIFNGLNADTDDYQVIAQDEDGETPKNAVIRDRIRPVRGYQGSTYYGNWRNRVNDLGALMVYDGQVVRDYQDVDRAQSDYVPTIGSGFAPHADSFSVPIISYGTTQDQRDSVEKPIFATSITPGDPSIPATVFHTQKMTIPAAETNFYPGDAGYQQDPANMALELVVDVGSLDSDSGWCAFMCSLRRDGKDPYFGYQNPGLIGLFYNVSEKYFRLSVGAKNDESFWSSSYRYHVGDIDMSGLQGVHHIVFSVTYSLEGKLYVDGELLQTVSLATIPGAHQYARNTDFGHLGGMHIAGEYTDDYGESTSGVLGMRGRVGAMAFYPHAISADDVQLLYKDLMVGTEPALTGYKKEVFADRPSFYLRLDDPPGTTSVKNLAGNRVHGTFDATIYGAPIFQSPSIVVGGHTTRFDGRSGLKFLRSGPRIHNPFGFTVSFIAKPDTKVPGSTEYLLRTYTYNDGYDWGIRIVRLSDGRLRLSVKTLGGNTEDIEFNTIQDDSELHHYLVSVDKAALSAVLYIDGSAVETSQASPSQILLPRRSNSTSSNYRYWETECSIAASIDESGNVAYGYKGLLGEIWVSQNPTTPERAKQIYDATKVI